MPAVNLALSVRFAERCPASGGKDDEGPNNSEAHGSCLHRTVAVQAGDGSSRWRDAGENYQI